MENKQLTHLEFKQLQKTFKNNVVLILENLQYNENIGSAFRLADAFNIEEIIIVTDNKLLLNKINKTSRSTEKYIKHQIVSTTNEALTIVNKKGYTVFALEITTKSKPLRKYNFSNYNGVALVVGNEKNGINQNTLTSVKNTIHIDMFGNNSSINVSNALAIALHKISEDNYKNKEKN